jgi:hypothetical protein
MKKIKTITSSCPATLQYYVSPIHWFLKINHQTTGLSKNQYIWTSPLFLLNHIEDNLKILTDLIIKEKIDILAFSVYVWNREFFFSLAKQLKSLFENLIIIVGGPEIDAHKNSSFFVDNYYIDFAVYGDGEDAFTKILDFLAGHDVKLINAADSTTVYPHEVFVNKKTLSKSPYIEYKNEIFSFLEDIKEYFKTYFPVDNIDHKLLIVWETTKGCPYACSFCDWSSGLHNKVRIWGKDELEPLWRKEIDLFFEWNLSFVYWTNPNVGLTPQDEHIIEYWCEKKINNNNKGPEIFNPQWSKLNKQKVFYLLDKMIEAEVTKGYKFDLQDLDKTVLENINRPEVPWPDHKQLIINIKNKYGNISHIKYTNRLTFIWGLPGQTLKNLENNMAEAGTLDMFAHHLPFEILPNTPAANQSYIDKFKLVIKKIEIVGHGEAFNNQIQKNWVIPKAVVSTYSMNEREWYEGMILFYIYNSRNSYQVTYNTERNLFKNKHKVQNLIDCSYLYYQKFSSIGMLESNRLISVYEWTKKNLEFVNTELYSSI